MSGEIVRQQSSYRQGLVLGLTMAEIMVLLVFCLLIAMATFLKSEQDKRSATEKKLEAAYAQQALDRGVAEAFRQDKQLVEKLQELSGSNETKELDEFWRELVESRAIVKQLEKSGLQAKDVKDQMADLSGLRSSGVDVGKAVRDAETLNAINRLFGKPDQPVPSVQMILDTLERGLSGSVSGGHQWPPIISMSEAGGYNFRSGSAELSKNFEQSLLTDTPAKIVEFIKKYDVDVIEVVGHTDEKPLGARQSNLDRDLLPVLTNTKNVVSLTPADNAGLGLARAVSVVSVLRRSAQLKAYKLIPLSGAQLVNTDETLAIQGVPADIAQRRRIEIRLRKSVPREMAAPVEPAPAPAVAAPKVRRTPKQQPLSLQPPAPKLFFWQN